MDAFANTLSAPDDLLADDDVFPTLCKWHREGVRTALVTLVGIDGAAPRPLGAQMAVAEDGRYVGYLSGGCLEQAVALEAEAAIVARQNRLVRFGRGSRYFDVQLPCGSGIDLYFDCALDGKQLGDIEARIATRQSFVLRTDLATGANRVRAWKAGVDGAGCARKGDEFARVFHPKPRLLLLGSGPTVPALATVAASTGLDTDVWSPDEFTRTRLRELGLPCGASGELSEDAFARIDFATAVVLIFHDHDIEPPLLAKLLRHDCFYIGALGSRAVHRQRLDALAEIGCSTEELARLRAPIGLIQGAKSKATLAVGILAQILSEAKVSNLVA